MRPGLNHVSARACCFIFYHYYKITTLRELKLVLFWAISAYGGQVVPCLILNSTEPGHFRRNSGKTLIGNDEKLSSIYTDVFYRSSHPEVSLRKSVLKICSEFPGEHPCRSVISIKLHCNFIEIALWLGCSPVNLLHIFRIPFPRNTFGWLLLIILLSILYYKQDHQKPKHYFADKKYDVIFISLNIRLNLLKVDDDF